METSTQQHEQRPRIGGQQNSGPSQSEPIRVIVSGYPGGTKARQLQDLFPGSRVVTLGWRRSTLSFQLVAEAEAAVRTRVSCDGLPLTVTFKNDRSGFKAHDKKVKKKPRPQDKELEPELDPRLIDFSGDFHEQLDSVLAHVRLTQEEVNCISQLFDDVENVLQEYWPGCTAHPFGSLTTGLGMKGSDADCLMLGVQPDQHTVNRARRLLRQYPTTFRQVISIPTAHTPIVKFLHVPTNTRADLSFKTTLGVRNSKLLAFLLHADPRAPPTAVVIKYWGRVAGFTGSGKLTNYALVMMVLFYLQQRMLPPVCQLQSPATEHIVDGWDTGFDARYEALPPTTCDVTIAELIGGFFEFYAAFDFERDVVNPYLGRPVRRSVFEDPSLLPPEYELYRRNVYQGDIVPFRTKTAVCVQDPFEHSHNVASMLSPARAEEMKAFMVFAAESYRREKKGGCLGFLKTILLQRPVLRAKKIPEYRVVLREPYLTRLGADWQSKVRDTTLRIFDEMLKLAPTRAENKEDSTRQRYVAVLKKPIWQRKDVARHIRATTGFVNRQCLITELILANATNEFSLPVNLEIQSSARRAVIAVRATPDLTEDSVHKFKEFGQFFLATVQSWMYQLLDTQLVRNIGGSRNINKNDPQIATHLRPPNIKNNLSDDEGSLEDEHERLGPIVVTNSLYKNTDTEVAEVTESLKKSLGIDDDFKFNFKLDGNAKEVNVQKSDSENSSSENESENRCD